MKCDLPFVNSFQDRHGRWRYYFRRKGQKAVALPAPAGWPPFIAAYNGCLEKKSGEPLKIRSAPGSLDALREQYYASAEFANMAETTTGHLSGQMEQHYSKRADQKKNAERAVLNWGRADKNKRRKLQTGE